MCEIKGNKLSIKFFCLLFDYYMLSNIVLFIKKKEISRDISFFTNP